MGIKSPAKAAVIVPSAGSGKRMKSCTDKPFIGLAGKELISYSLKVLQEDPLVSEIIIPAKASGIKKILRIVKKNSLSKVKAVIRGGKERFQSVYNALVRVSPDVDYVIIHDCARPFITKCLIEKTLSAAKRYGAAVAAVKVKPTIKESCSAGNFIKRTLKRSCLREAQTPQAFRKDILINAYKKVLNTRAVFTDCASIIENAGERVRIVEGDYDNIKITTPEDLVVAEAILKRLKDKSIRRRRLRREK